MNERDHFKTTPSWWEDYLTTEDGTFTVEMPTVTVATMRFVFPKPRYLALAERFERDLEAIRLNAEMSTDELAAMRQRILDLGPTD